ncbi:uncharacterized protein si:ch211-195m9.3 [Toxotes jaculatrix]|uniref:uncharacterized protein si:ch211-195m9.3 n=1 Tax=Toxotes jaculatrix TaxID=941984 RepID=UPI001B3B0848|nr:uncharacterized protein si:ch211-195m9.3 [Toxotes jaculatrix]
MSLLSALGLVWLVCGFTCVCEAALDAKAASKKHCDHRKTCEGIAYDIREAVCCEKKLHSGAVLSCCGNQPYNPAVATCCKVEQKCTLHVNVTLGLSEEVSACCGLEAYNPLNEMCCQSTVVPKPVPKAQCCGKDAFDVDKQLCCGPLNNKTILTRKSSHHQCCGHAQYDTLKECCFWNDEISEVHPLNSSSCANESAQIVSALCFQSSTTATLPPQAQYCDKEVFDVDKQLCCGPYNNKTILTRKSSHHQCCGHGQYDTLKECCFWNDEISEVHPLNSSHCASGHAPKSPQPNCTKPDLSLCGSSCYNPKEFHCCERNQTKTPWCGSAGQCDGVPTVYNPRTQFCCDGCVLELKSWRDQDREDGEEFSEISIPYNPAKGTVCCFQFHGSPGQHCCGTEIYQPHTEICCDGHRHPKVENGHCCGIKAYNTKDPQMKCCAGTLHNVTSLSGTRECCGSSLQNPEDVCCSSEDKELLYSNKKGFRCCGHLYYNTSLWSCCAGTLSPLHQPHQCQDKIKESRFLSVSNLNDTHLCEEMKIGTVESVSPHSIVFSSALKIHGMNATVSPLPTPYILKTDYCNFPKLIPGKTYFFDEVTFFTDFSHDSVFQSLHFIVSKCYPIETP